MDKMLTLGIAITAKNLASATFGKLTGQIGDIGKSAEMAKARMSAMETASYGFGTAVTSKIFDSYKMYANVAKAQGEIASLGIGSQGIEAITKKAEDFAMKWAGTTAPEFIKASYDIKSGIASLSDTAVGEFTRMAALTGTATKSTTAEMTELFALGHGIFRNQFGSDVEFGEKFSGAISQAVKAFRTDGSDLSSGLSTLGAVATSFGVSLSEQLAVLGTAKGAFNSASEAATSYRAFLNGAGKAQKDLGLTFVDSQGKMLAMPKILKKIKDKYGDISKVETMDKIKKAFGSDEAVKMLTAMVDKSGDLEKSIHDLNDAMENGTKTTEEMAQAMQQGQGLVLLGQQFDVLSGKIGKAFAPSIEGLANSFSHIAEWAGSLSDENKELLKIVAGGIAIFAGFITVIGAVGIAVGAVTTAFAFLGITTMAAFLPITLIVGGLALGAYALISNWELVSTFWSGVWTDIESISGTVWNGLKTLFSWTPLGMIINNWTPIKVFFADLINTVTGWFSNMFAWFDKKMQAVGSTVSNIKGFFGFSDAPISSGAARKPISNQKMAPIASRSGGNNTVAVTINNPNFTSKEHATQTQKQIDEQVRKAMARQANDKKDRSYS